MASEGEELCFWRSNFGCFQKLGPTLESPNSNTEHSGHIYILRKYKKFSGYCILTASKLKNSENSNNSTFRVFFLYLKSTKTKIWPHFSFSNFSWGTFFVLWIFYIFSQKKGEKSTFLKGFMKNLKKATNTP